MTRRQKLGTILDRPDRTGGIYLEYYARTRDNYFVREPRAALVNLENVVGERFHTSCNPKLIDS
ncbi:MAG: hypothetical protein EBE86_034895 [Hormoscilla sp. GUM202]|nr:hypothetical protein [Hormoscilla sp. GUM202]